MFFHQRGVDHLWQSQRFTDQFQKCPFHNWIISASFVIIQTVVNKMTGRISDGKTQFPIHAIIGKAPIPKFSNAEHLTALDCFLLLLLLCFCRYPNESTHTHTHYMWLKARDLLKMNERRAHRLLVEVIMCAYGKRYEWNEWKCKFIQTNTDR